MKSDQKFSVTRLFYSVDAGSRCQQGVGTSIRITWHNPDDGKQLRPHSLIVTSTMLLHCYVHSLTRKYEGVTTFQNDMNKSQILQEDSRLNSDSVHTTHVPVSCLEQDRQ